jgi:hypothetical protein
MTGAIEGGVQVATGFIDSLKSQPLSLALVLMNVCLLGFFWLILDRVASQRKEEVELLYQDKRETRELISKCVVPAVPQQRTQIESIAPVSVQPGMPKLCTPEKPC